MKLAHKQSGFGAVEIILIVVLVGALGLIAWRVYDTNTALDKANNEVTATQAQDLQPDVQNIKNPEDFTKAEKALDDTDLTADGSNELDQELNF